MFLAALSLLVAALPVVRAEDAAAILQEVLQRRPTKDITLKGRLFITRDQFEPAEILVKNEPDQTRTIYRTGSMELLVVQPLTNAPRYYLKGKGELTGQARLGRLLDSQFVFYDLGLPFLHWPQAKLLGTETMRGRDCYLIEVSGPRDAPYSKVKLWIDKQYKGLLRAEACNENGDPVRRFSVTSFRKVDEIWVPSGLDSAYLPPGQALPAQERSRLEIREGNYDAQLPAAQFDPAGFGP
jgi:hypothetical protein